MQCGMWDLSSPTRDRTPASLYWEHGVSTTGSPGNPLALSILKLILHPCLESGMKIQCSLPVCSVTLGKWLDPSEPALLRLHRQAEGRMAIRTSTGAVGISELLSVRG